MTVIGMEGLPSDLSLAGNAIIKSLKYRCSLRMAPTQKGDDVTKLLQTAFEREDPETFNAKIEFKPLGFGPGFSAPDLPQSFKENVHEATREIFEGNDPLYVGCGGSIPFMEVFSNEFPKANFILTGCGFADSNAHGPNENLDIQFCCKLTTCISLILSKL